MIDESTQQIVKRSSLQLRHCVCFDLAVTTMRHWAHGVMTLLPIVDRELRVAARRPGTYWLRFWVALLVLAVWIVLLTKSRHVSPSQMGQHLLNALGVITIGFSMLAGVFLTSDCLSEEIREGTLGLLFLTDLKSYDVVLGKLVANSLHAFFGLLAVYPVLGLAVLLGGVTGREFWRLLLVYAVTLFFSVSVGLIASATSRDAKQAIQRALIAVAVLAGVFPALWWLQWSIWKSGAMDFLLLPSPVYAYLKGFDTGYRFGQGAREFWLSLGTIFSLGLSGIVAATVLLPRMWQDRTASSGEASPAKEARRLRSCVALAWQNPVFWLTVRDASPRRFAMGLLVIVAPIWIGLVFAMVNSTLPIPLFITCFLVAFGLHQIIKILVTAEASRRIHQDRQSGALELLLVTPLPIRALLAGQKAALVKHFAPALFVLSLFNVALCILVWNFPKPLQMNWRDAVTFCELFAGGIIALICDFSALGWVAMWRGLKARKHQRAIGETVLQVMGIPWLAVFFLFFLQPNVGGPWAAAIVFGVWFVLGIVVDIASAGVARMKLETEFRLVATERFGGR
jgi:ABC-type transport system involved in multi-copper enzyme maturation permease subunit